jgi:hypothetical protein
MSRWRNQASNTTFIDMYFFFKMKNVESVYQKMCKLNCRMLHYCVVGYISEIRVSRLV